MGSLNLSSEESGWTTGCLELPGCPLRLAILNNIDMLTQQILTMCLFQSWSLILRVCTGWRQAGEEAGGADLVCKKAGQCRYRGVPGRAPRLLFGGQEKAPEDRKSKGSP